MSQLIVIVPALMENFPDPIEKRNLSVGIMSTNEKNVTMDQNQDISQVRKLEFLKVKISIRKPIIAGKTSSIHVK